MKIPKRHASLILIFLASLAPLASFGDELGDPAPPLTIKEWIKGGPVEIKPGTNTYVVEIWNTTGANARGRIASLNEIQKKYKEQGLIVVGVSDESPEKIRQFVERPDVKVEYAIAADTNRRTAMDYMMGFKLRTIPHVFVVGKDAKLLWHGDPARGLDQALSKILAGKFELERAKETDMFRRQVEEYQAMVRKGDPRAHAAGELLISRWTNNVSHLCDFAYVIVRETGNPRRDLALAGEALDQAEKVGPTNAVQLVAARGAFLFEKGKQDEAIAMVKQAIVEATDPKEKAGLEPYLRAMEARKAKAIARTNAPATTTNVVTITNIITRTNTVTITNAVGAQSRQ
jgi:hypothetical protein